MASWDVFHADRLELQKGLDAETIRASLARGELRDDDLIRPAGTTIPWARIADFPELLAPPSPPEVEPEPAPEFEFGSDSEIELMPEPKLPSRGKPGFEPPSDFEEIEPDLDRVAPPSRKPGGPFDTSSSDVAFPVVQGNDEPAPEPPPKPIRAEARPVPPRPETPKPEAVPKPGPPKAEARPEPPKPEPKPAPPVQTQGPASLAPTIADWQWDEDNDEDDDQAFEEEAAPDEDAEVVEEGWPDRRIDLDDAKRPDSRGSQIALPVAPSRDRIGERVHVEDEDDDEATFSLARSATQKIEELDLAPMVDVAFQLVLFFMVTATTVLYKTLEIPKPSADDPPSAVAQGRSRTLDELKEDNILLEIDAGGALKLDREPIEANRQTLIELLRRTREKTGRKTLLISADFTTPHRNAVMAYDAANEIGLAIAIAKPQAPQGPAPTLRPGGQ